MVKTVLAPLTLLLAAATPAAAFTWTLGPPPPLPPLPRAALSPANPHAVATRPAVRWQVVTHKPALRWERVPANAPAPTQELAGTPHAMPAHALAVAPQALAMAPVSARPRWERVPTHERILHANVLAIVSAPDPTELVQLDRPALRWESFPPPQSQPQVSSFGMVPTPTVRPVLGRRVWFRF